MYLIAGIVAALVFVLSAHPASTVPLVGASGAIAGVLACDFILYPRHVVFFAFFTVLPVPSVLFLGLWFLGQFAVGDAGVAWESHVGGFVFGAALTALFRGQLLGRVEAAHANSTPGW